MENEDIISQIQKAVQGILNNHRVEIVELVFQRQSGEPRLRFLVDKPEGGITLGECTQLNREIGELLDRQNLIDQRYVLEVSSPGLDRPLKTEEDFRRVKGKSLRLVAKMPLKDAPEESIPVDLVGILVGVKETTIILEEEEGKKQWEIPLESIIKGVRHIRF